MDVNLNNRGKFLALGGQCSGMVFFAADESYFRQHGIFLMQSSLRHNPDWFVHVHLYDPSRELMQVLDGIDRVSYSQEVLDDVFFATVVNEIKTSSMSQSINDPQRIIKICKTIKAHDRNKWCGVLAHLLPWYSGFCRLIPKASLTAYLRKTYYACQRFVVLDALSKTQGISGDILALDSDALFNRPLPTSLQRESYDLSLRFRASNSGQHFLAGSIHLPPSGRRAEFLARVAHDLESSFSLHVLDWGLDQIVLNRLVPEFDWAPLDNALCDLEFLQDSIVWLAKGKTKSDAKYKTAQVSNQLFEE